MTMLWILGCLGESSIELNEPSIEPNESSIERTTCVPSAEQCDGEDNDCDDLVDEMDADLVGAVSWALDADADRYGDPNLLSVACDQPAGHVANQTDCDDASAAVNPEAIEVCNDRDDDCDGLTDVEDDSLEGASIWYADADGDGLGDASATTRACAPPSGYVSDATDCDDENAAVRCCGCPLPERSPERWQLDVARDADVWIEAEFDTATLNEDTFLVYGDISGFLRGTVTVGAGRATFTPDGPAHPGERLTAVLTDAVVGTSGERFGPLVWTWTAAVDGGTGVLASAGEIATGLSYSYGIVAHDFDGDGDLEVATSDAQGDTVSVFDGAPGALSMLQSVAVPNSPNYLQGADVDRDGDIDLIVVTEADLQVLVNDGTGAFGEPVAFSTDSRAEFTSVRAAELDGDGDLDLVLSACWSEALVVMLNDGTGGFAVASEVLYNLDANPFPLGVGDIDNDDDLDVILPLELESRVSVLVNDGAAGFSELTSVPVGGQPKAVVLNDMNGDGYADAVVPALSGDVFTLVGDGAGAFTTTDLALTYVHGACGGDLDADGDIDVAVPTFYQYTVESLFNDGAGGFSVEQTFTTSRPGTSVFCADLDGDGAMDVLLASGLPGDSSITAYLNNR